jgi:hypothetical protein
MEPIRLNVPATGTTREYLVPGFDHGLRPYLTFVLKTLNGKHKRMVGDQLAFFLGSDFQNPTPAVTSALEAIASDPSILEYAISGMITTMRTMADMWIDSGKKSDADIPTERNVVSVLSGPGENLFGMIRRLLPDDYLRFTVMTPEGKFESRDRFPEFDRQRLAEGLRVALEIFGETWAAFHFSRFLDSQHSHRIARCDNCGTYFAYQRTRLRMVLRGVFCPKCTGKGAQRRTKVSREKRLETAARAWIEWESKRSSKPQWQWVCDAVSKSHGVTFGRRWVTQNLSEIQQRVEALRNA